MKKFIFSILKKLRNLVSGHENFFRKFPFITNTFNALYQSVAPKGIVSAKVQGHTMFMDAKSSGLVLVGVWEKHETEAFKAVVKEGMTVVDIGAHIGYYAVIAAELVSNNGKVYAFEPEPENYSLLEKNIETNGYQHIITPVKKAVSNKAGITKLFLGTSALHSLLDSGNAKSMDIEAVALDGFFAGKEKIDVIKIDAEGAEYLIFQGMQNILQANKNLIIFTEFYPALLKKYVDPRKYLEGLVGSNFELFLIGGKKLEHVTMDYIMTCAAREKDTYSINLLCKRNGR